MVKINILELNTAKKLFTGSDGSIVAEFEFGNKSW